MSKTHVVTQGECLSSIAHHYGFLDWHAIYDAQENAGFRKKRPNPNVIFPGDVLAIPDRTEKPMTIGTGKLHEFRAKVAKSKVAIALVDAGTHRYRLAVEGNLVSEGTTGPGAPIVASVSPDASEGELTVWPEDAESPEAAGARAVIFPVLIGHLDPAETTGGVQARLRHLGYYRGDVDGLNGPLTMAAIASFQEDNPPLDADGYCGPLTRPVLVEKHGC